MQLLRMDRELVAAARVVRYRTCWDAPRAWSQGNNFRQTQSFVGLGRCLLARPFRATGTGSRPSRLRSRWAAVSLLHVSLFCLAGGSSDSACQQSSPTRRTWPLVQTANCNCTLQQQFRRMQHSPHRRTKIYTEFVITLRLIYITESNRVILEYMSQTFNISIIIFRNVDLVLGTAAPLRNGRDPPCNGFTSAGSPDLIHDRPSNRARGDASRVTEPEQSTRGFEMHL